ncbi:MAG TPA: NADH-quinone oxidoreductase subunit NuoN [Bacillales bacterium]|nr:NADH-quinone oxidoreductase subunit NuoN [Bacillales bacterium]
MDWDTLLSYDWSIMAPEFTIFITAVVLSLMDLFTGRHFNRRLLAWWGLAGVAIAFLFCLTELGTPITTILAGTYRFDSFALAFKMLMLIGAGFVLLMSAHYDQKGEIFYRGEFYYLMLSALLGAMMMASSADMITLFVSLELLSLSSYILTGLRKRDLASNEAAFKYLVNGGIATAIILFGMSYIYGFAGTTNLYAISEVFTSHVPSTSALLFSNRFLIVFAMILVFVGLSFKLATVPFHMWAPDVYQGSPTPVTAFLSVVSKIAGFAMLLRFFFIGVARAPGIHISPQTGPEFAFVSIEPYISVLAVLAMIIGNTAALKQQNIKRLFAYSSIAQAGYVLVPFIALSKLSLANVWFYLMAYLFMNLGAFAVIQVVTEKEGSEDLESFSGLYRRAPWAAVSMGVFLVSLAGIPVTAGFIGKFNIFLSALVTNHYWLASIMIGTTVISYFYYFGIMGKMFLRPALHSGKLSFPAGAAIVIGIGVIGTLGFGIFPDAALGFLHNHFQLNDFFQANQ